MNDPDLADALRLLLDDFSRSGVATLHVRSGEFELLLSNDPAAGTAAISQPAVPRPAAPPKPNAAAAASPAPVAPSRAAPATDLPEGAIIVTAPNLGTFYRAPKPGADFYVEVGGAVAVGQEICLIEVMKLFTAVRAETSGRVHAVLAEDGAMVEAGQPLFALVAA